MVITWYAETKMDPSNIGTLDLVGPSSWRSDKGLLVPRSTPSLSLFYGMTSGFSMATDESAASGSRLPRQNKAWDETEVILHGLRLTIAGRMAYV